MDIEGQGGGLKYKPVISHLHWLCHEAWLRRF